MPWSYPDNVPSFAKNKSESDQKTAVEVANTTLKKTGNEESAIFAAIAALKPKTNTIKSFKRPSGASDRVTPSHIPTKVQEAIVEAVKKPEQHIKKAFLPANSLEPGIERNLVQADFNPSNQLVLTFDNGEVLKTKPIAIEEYVENYVTVKNIKEGVPSSTVSFFKTNLTLIANEPQIVVHSLGLDEATDFTYSAFVGNVSVLLEVQAIDNNSVEVLTEVDIPSLRLNILGVPL